VNILFVDDLPDRVKQFRQQAIGHSVVVAETFDQAMNALRNVGPAKFDCIYLDYDLLPEHYGDDKVTKGTGDELAAYICSHSRKFKDTTVILHSLKHRGRERMKARFDKAMVRNIDAPWAWLRPVPYPGVHPKSA